MEYMIYCRVKYDILCLDGLLKEVAFVAYRSVTVAETACDTFSNTQLYFFLLFGYGQLFV